MRRGFPHPSSFWITVIAAEEWNIAQLFPVIAGYPFKADRKGHAVRSDDKRIYLEIVVDRIGELSVPAIILLIADSSSSQSNKLLIHVFLYIFQSRKGRHIEMLSEKPDIICAPFFLSPGAGFDLAGVGSFCRGVAIGNVEENVREGLLSLREKERRGGEDGLPVVYRPGDLPYS
jgi:hypothetical protein